MMNDETTQNSLTKLNNEAKAYGSITAESMSMPMSMSSDDNNDDNRSKNDDNDLEATKETVPPAPVNLNTRFAADRTYMAADRTAIAWVRTAISMIGFGVTIAKTADLLESQGLIENTKSMKSFGVVFVGIAWLGLVLVIVQNVAMERRLAASGYGRVECLPLGLSMAILVLLVGILGALVIFHPIHTPSN